RRNGGRPCIRARWSTPARGFVAAQLLGRIAASAQALCLTTQSYGRVHKLLPKVSWLVVLSAPEKPPPARIATSTSNLMRTELHLFAYRDEPWLVRRAFYESALDEVRKLHRLPESVCVEMRQHLPAEFNTALYLWEQNYFFENCLGRYFEVEKAEIDTLAGLSALQKIAEKLAQLPRVLVHRDFQSQNILLRNGQAYLIDFQGMRPGLAHYDMASLLYDPYVDLSQAERDELLEHYCREKPGADFMEALRLCAMQRLMQALGAYGFLGLVKDHKHFLQHIPKAVRSLREIVGGVAGLEPLGNFLAKLG